MPRVEGGTVTDRVDVKARKLGGHPHTGNTGVTRGSSPRSIFGVLLIGNLMGSVHNPPLPNGNPQGWLGLLPYKRRLAASPAITRRRRMTGRKDAHQSSGVAQKAVATYTISQLIVCNVLNLVVANVSLVQKPCLGRC
jgi:hypothetical protein